jgi:membrane protein YqaA with SNARE-associated domain
MIFQIVILSLVLFFSPLVPPVLSPLAYSMTGILLLQKADPLWLWIITIAVVTIANVVVWILQDYIIQKINLQKKTNYVHTGVFAWVLKKFDYHFNDKTRISKFWLKRQHYAETKEWTFVTFVFAIFCFLPVLPDIVGNRILYKKIKFPYFILAVIIGKTISHGWFIFLWKSILLLLNF